MCYIIIYLEDKFGVGHQIHARHRRKIIASYVSVGLYRGLVSASRNSAQCFSLSCSRLKCRMPLYCAVSEFQKVKFKRRCTS